MAVTTMELLELLRKADGADVDCLREGVRVLAQALVDAEVSAQVGAEHGQRNPERTTHRNGYPGPGLGHPGRHDRPAGPRVGGAATCLVPGAPPAGRAGAGGGRGAALRRGRLDPAGGGHRPGHGHHQPVQVPGLPGLRRAR
jgi:Transposase, Mutator family